MATLSGKVAIVTGGAQGLGAAFATALAAEGAAVAIGDILPADDVASAINKAGGRCIATTLDVCDPSSVAACISRTIGAFGHIDILVNNAGLFTNLPIQPFTEIRVKAGTGSWQSMCAAPSNA